MQGNGGKIRHLTLIWACTNIIRNRPWR